MVKGEDGEMCEMEIIGTREKQSIFQKSAPIMHPLLASVFLFLNVVPGLGTFLAAFTLICCGRSSFDTNLEGFLVGIGTAVLQLITSVVIVGWIWSLLHGAYFVRKAVEEKEAREESQNQNIA